jgi:hypothetical protein
LTVITLAMLAASTAWADSSFDGRWKQGPLREEYSVSQWLPGCGPAPVSGTSGGGDVVTVRTDGDELSILGGGRVFKSNQCYDQLPTLVRESHSRDPSGRSWRTRCATPANDPRRAIMNTLVAATSDNHIDLVETGQYYIKLNEGTCIAEVKRSRGFDRIADTPAPTATPTAPTATQPPAPPPKPPSCTPGEPARLEVRPSRKLMRPGESFAFRAVVTDASGCPTATATSWALADADDKRVSLDPGGKVTVIADAAEGTSDLVVTAANKSVHVTVEVATAANYDDLLAKQGLNAAGESDATATAAIAGSTIGGADTKAEDGARKRRNLFIAIVGSLAVVLGVLALVYMRRQKRATQMEREQDERHAERVRDVEERNRAKANAHAAQMRAHEESVQRAKAVVAQQTAKRAAAATPGTMVCPTCRREYPPPAGSFCPQDATKLVPVSDGEEALQPAGGVCPVCKRGFESGVKVCPTHGEDLIPYAAVAGAPTVSAHVPGKGKICPTCGGRFEGNTTFCGKDGTALVLLN